MLGFISFPVFDQSSEIHPSHSCRELNSLLMSDYIPEGIQFLILKLLPVKSLLQCRCVCKCWKQQIDSPTFLQEHLTVQNPLFLFNQYMEPEFIVVDPRALQLVHPLRGPSVTETGHRFHLLGTLHGVVCLYDYQTTLLLWNPSIAKLSTLPLPLYFEGDFRRSAISCYGFWIDPSTKEFKVVILMFDLIDGDVDDEIEEPLDFYGILYSSTQPFWISVDVPPLVKQWRQHSLSGMPVIIGRVAHWGGHQHNTRVIMSYDFGQQSFEFIEMPNLKSLASFDTTLCHWKGTLSLVYCDPQFPHRCEMYSRRQGSWVNMFGFNLLASIERVVWVLEGMGGNGIALVQQKDKKMALFDARSGCIPLTCGSSNVDVAYDFVESLVFPLE